MKEYLYYMRSKDPEKRRSTLFTKSSTLHRLYDDLDVRILLETEITPKGFKVTLDKELKELIRSGKDTIILE